MPGFSSFTSPEVLEYFNNPGENVFGSASDVFSMGCVLHDLLTGLHAFGRDADIHLTHPQCHQHILQRHALWVSLDTFTPFRLCTKYVSQMSCKMLICFIRHPSHAQVVAICSSMHVCFWVAEMSMAMWVDDYAKPHKLGGFCFSWIAAAAAAAAVRKQCMNAALCITTAVSDGELHCMSKTCTMSPLPSNPVRYQISPFSDMHLSATHTAPYAASIIPHSMLHTTHVTLCCLCALICLCFCFVTLNLLRAFKHTVLVSTCCTLLVLTCCWLLQDADLAQNKILPYGLEALREKLPNEKDCWEAEDLLQRMLQIEPSSRPSIEEALDHPFLQGS